MANLLHDLDPFERAVLQAMATRKKLSFPQLKLSLSFHPLGITAASSVFSLTQRKLLKKVLPEITDPDPQWPTWTITSKGLDVILSDPQLWPPDVRWLAED